MENNRKLQLKSLEMAEYFVKFCSDNNLLCYMCGGGAIGALRHKGFIPWDDDLDFFMPRTDYEKLKELWDKKALKKYSLVVSNQEKIDYNLFITIRDNDTTAIKPYQKDLDIPHGVALDILPLDFCPENKIQRKIQIFWALIYSVFCSQTIPKNHGKFKRNIVKFLLFIFKNKNTRYKIWKLAEKNMTKCKNSNLITELCSGPYYMKKIYQKSFFEKNIMVEFENTKMPIPLNADGYLKIAFGDYMKLPPKDKQIPSHDVLILDLDNSYTKYRGKY